MHFDVQSHDHVPGKLLYSASTLSCVPVDEVSITEKDDTVNDPCYNVTSPSQHDHTYMHLDEYCRQQSVDAAY